MRRQNVRQGRMIGVIALEEVRHPSGRAVACKMHLELHLRNPLKRQRPFRHELPPLLAAHHRIEKMGLPRAPCPASPRFGTE
jgi:hypothetical protein